MADKLRLGTEVRELKIGQSFTNNKAGAFHAVRYDFKPASVDINKIATVDIGNSNQVTVNVPHLDGAGVPATVFKGSHRPFTKECVLIIDRVTGEITLEKLSSNIQLKKTRSEKTVPQLPQERAERAPPPSNSSTNVMANAARPQTPPMSASNVGQRQSNKTRVTSGSRRPDRQITQLPNAPVKHSPLRASPNYSSPAQQQQQQQQQRSPKRDRHNGSGEASLPMIGIDDFGEEPAHEPPPPPPPAVPAAPPAQAANSLAASMDSWSSSSKPTKTQPSKSRLSSQSDSDEGSAHDMSDSSSTSSSSDSDSERDDDKKRNGHHPHANTTNGGGSHSNAVSGGCSNSGNGGGNSGNVAKLPSLPAMLLNDDLQLSESGSDFDDDD